MAKRARGAATRPGQRRPIQRPAATGRAGSSTAPAAQVVAPRPASLTPEEEARAGELEAAIVAEERQAEASRRGRSQLAEVAVRATSPLAVAAANEYAYVARDVRRVAMVGGTLVVLLVALWAAVQVTGVSL